METLIQLRTHGQWPRLVGRKAANIGHNQAGIRPGEELTDLQGCIDHTLQVVDRTLPISWIIRDQVEQLTVFKQLRRVYHQARTGHFAEEGLGLQTEVTIGQVKLVEIRLDTPAVVAEIVIAHRHAPANWQSKGKRLLRLLFVEVTVKEEVTLGNIAGSRFAKQLW